MVRQGADSHWWDRKNRRWSIKYLGKSHSISCRQQRTRECNVGDSKNTIEAAARRWRDEKRHTIDG
jgi:hypothetical protein